MLKLIHYLTKTGTVTAKSLFPQLAEGVRGLPTFSEAPCASEDGCNACAKVCPTAAITANSTEVSIDRGACISCGLCVSECHTGAIVNDRDTKVSRIAREDLVIHKKAATDRNLCPPNTNTAAASNPSFFQRSISLRVVSTGCSACDMEISACGNPIFDMERFGVHIVASPRYADALLVTGPVPKAMHDPLLRCYEAMSEPRLVIAVGTCAISGGIHKDGYASANGASAILPVDVFIPGCPPHPWNILHGILMAMRSRHLQDETR